MTPCRPDEMELIDAITPQHTHTHTRTHTVCTTSSKHYVKIFTTQEIRTALLTFTQQVVERLIAGCSSPLVSVRIHDMQIA
jgi:hypothetical protein